jgi:DNA-binding PadR family transcriptional regulator
MPSGDTRLGEFEQVLLFALLRLGDDAYGVTIRRDIEERTGRTVSSGAVYTAMERLEAQEVLPTRAKRRAGIGAFL